MEDNLKFVCKWKTTSYNFVVEDEPNYFCKWKTIYWFGNGRQLNLFLKIEEYLPFFFKWKTTSEKI
jgi:hypothetical protein